MGAAEWGNALVTNPGRSARQLGCGFMFSWPRRGAHLPRYDGGSEFAP